MADRFSNVDNVDSPSRRFAPIGALNDGSDLADITKALYFNVAGTVSVVAADDVTNTPVSFVVQAGALLPLRVKRIRSTGTSLTAADIIGLY